MPCKCKRYDAWGNVILPHNAMLTYFANDPQSIDILRRYMAHRFAVLPDVEIRIPGNDNSMVYIYLIYPGSTTEKTVFPSQAMLCALRKTWKGRKGWTRRMDKMGYAVMHHKGRVVYDFTEKYAVRRKHQ